MEVLEAIKTRRSIRKFMDGPVEWGKVGKILDAGRLAPNAGNLQCWKFLVITDNEKRQKIAEAALKQLWMAKAPVFIIICGDLDKIRQFYSERGEKLYIIQDCAMAAENMLLAAHAQGLGSCPVGAFVEESVSRIMEIPENWRPMLILPIGYPDEKPTEPLKYTLENVVRINHWGTLGRIASVEDVAWSYRWGEKAVKHGEELVKGVEKEVKKRRLTEKIAKKGKELRQKLEEQAKKRKKG